MAKTKQSSSNIGRALMRSFILHTCLRKPQSGYSLLAKGKERDVLAINAAGLLLHCLLLCYFVPSSGLLGAGVAVIISSTALLAASAIALLYYTYTRERTKK